MNMNEILKSFTPEEAMVLTSKETVIKAMNDPILKLLAV